MTRPTGHPRLAVAHHRRESSRGETSHRGNRQHRRRSRRGATIIEAAFALPILLTMVMALADFGIGVLQTSQVTSAAADGARAALIWRGGTDQPDVVGTPSHGRIEQAVAGRLIGRTFTFEARCVTPASATVACRLANAEVDRIRVTVWSKFRPVSPLGHVIAGDLIVTNSATMALVRQPENFPVTPSSVPTTTTMPTTTTTAPTTPTTVPATTTTVPATTTTTIPACAVLSVSTDPSPLEGNGSGKLRNDSTITVTTNGGACGSMAVRVDDTSIGLAGGPTYVGTLQRGMRLDIGANPVVVTSNGTAMFQGSIEVEK